MPRPPRFFISSSDIAGDRVTLSGDDVRHITAVLRMKTGDELLLCDGQGTEYRAAIVQAGRAVVCAEIKGTARREAAVPRITLGQGLPKSDKMDWIVQKATELGVSAVVPLVTERTVVKVKDEEKRRARWQKIAREAAMQSDRPDIPRIGTIRSFKEFLGTLDPEPRTLLLLPWEEAATPIRDVLKQHSGAKEIAVLIGPEGGFSASEASAAQERGFHPVSLGPNILRTETAAVAVLAMIGYEL